MIKMHPYSYDKSSHERRNSHELKNSHERKHSQTRFSPNLLSAKVLYLLNDKQGSYLINEVVV